MKKTLYIALLGLIVFAGCKRDEEFEGPALRDLFGEFTVLEDPAITNASPNFETNESAVFTAIFSKQVDWEVRITGQETGAVKLITGFSSDLNADNARWMGTTTELPLFRAEMCDVVISVPAEDFLWEGTMEVESTRVPVGLLVTDFEGDFNPGWETFVQSGADMSFNITSQEVAGQGNSYYDMGGEVNWDWLIGLIEFPASALGDSETYNLSSDPANVYFNVMVNVPEGITNEVILFQFREDDDGDDVFTENSEDMFSMELKNLDSGWQLISVRYGDLATLINGAPAAPLGNGIYEPHKLQRISVLFLAEPSSGYSQTLMDYLIFTENGPLQP